MFNQMYYDGRGLGTLVCDDAGCYDDGSGSTTTVYGPGAGQQPATGGGPGTPGYTPIPGTPISSPTNVAPIIGAIGNVFSSIFKTIQPLPSGCTQVAGPYGVSTQCLGSGSSTSPLSLSSFGTSVGGGSGILLIGGAILVIALMSKK